MRFDPEISEWGNLGGGMPARGALNKIGAPTRHPVK
jgi:hypothetical protein